MVIDPVCGMSVEEKSLKSLAKDPICGMVVDRAMALSSLSVIVNSALLKRRRALA